MLDTAFTNRVNLHLHGVYRALGEGARAPHDEHKIIQQNEFVPEILRLFCNRNLTQVRTLRYSMQKPQTENKPHRGIERPSTAERGKYLVASRRENTVWERYVVHPLQKYTPRRQ